jgi:hypothetical protein
MSNCGKFKMFTSLEEIYSRQQNSDGMIGEKNLTYLIVLTKLISDMKMSSVY